MSEAGHTMRPKYDRITMEFITHPLHGEVPLPHGPHQISLNRYVGSSDSVRLHDLLTEPELYLVWAECEDCPA